MSTMNGKQAAPPRRGNERPVDDGRPLPSHFPGDTVHRRAGDGSREQIYPPIMIADESAVQPSSAARGIAIALGIVVVAAAVITVIFWAAARLIGGVR